MDSGKVVVTLYYDGPLCWFPREGMQQLGQNDTQNAHTSFHGAVNTLRPKQNRRYFADDIFSCIFLNENIWISLKISRKFVSEVRINNIPALVQIMAWRRSVDKPLSGTMMVSLLTHICVTRPQWVKYNGYRNTNFSWPSVQLLSTTPAWFLRKTVFS